MRYGLEGAGLILTPDRQPAFSFQRVGLLNQLFLAGASGSLTRTTPDLRWRSVTPVLHQVRLFCQAQAGLVQGAPDRECADPGQPVRGLAQDLAQQAQ